MPRLQQTVIVTVSVYWLVFFLGHSVYDNICYDDDARTNWLHEMGLLHVLPMLLPPCWPPDNMQCGFPAAINRFMYHFIISDGFFAC
jgi:hypothetical protein